MSKLQDTELKCHVCGGSGDVLSFVDNQNHNAPTIRKCAVCGGAGLSAYGRAMNEDFPAIGVCPTCGANMVHYRLRGYVCRHCENKQDE